MLSDISSSNNYLEINTIDINPEPIDIEKIYSEIHTEPKDAYYEINPFKVYPEVTGISFDKEYAKNILKDYDDEYIIPLEIIKPDVTISNLDIDIFPDLISTFTTKYDASNKDRTTNLELASSKINGTVISPGEEFSYNQIVGARTISAGYKEAKIYSNGEVVDGIGGGICQISSTLYNAVVFANLNITERHNHQFVTSYVSAGRDSTIVYGSKDLRFINNRSYPIKIESKVQNGIVYCSIYGIKENIEYNVDFDIETISMFPPTIKYEQDDSLISGTEQIQQKGAKGTVVNVYKILKLNGKIISKTLLSHDNYNALERIILINSYNN